MRYLVYKKSTRGEPFPQLWYGDRFKGTGGFQDKPVGDPESDLLYFQQLGPEDDELSFAELIKKYPYKKGFVGP